MLARSLVIFLFMIPGFVWSQTEYFVVEGDTLLKIADKNLGNTDRSNPARYEFVRQMMKLNPSIQNPNNLEPGQTIVLPRKAHAKIDPAKITEPTVTLKTAEGVPVQAQAPVVETPVPAPVEHPVAVTQAEEAKPEAHKSEHHNFFFVQPRYSTVELVSKNEMTHTKAKMKSESSVGLDLQYGVILNEHYHLLFQGGVTSTQFGDLKGVNATVNHKSETLSYLAAGIALEATPNLHIDLMALYAQHTFLLPHSATEYELHAVAIPALELNLSWDYLVTEKNIFGISAIGEYLSKVKKDGVEYKSTFEPFGALYWKSNNGHYKINYKATLTYKHGHQETSVAKKAEEITTLGVGFYF